MFSLPAQAQGRPAWVQDKYFSRIFQIPFFRAKTHASGVHVLRIRNFRAAEDDCRDRTEYAREGANRQNPGVKRPASGSLPQFSIRRGGCRRPKGGERQRSAGCDSWARSSAVLRGSTWIDTSVSVYAEPGQKVAFVGATGAGKTTITNLINRFYDIADGKIRYDGININKIKKSDLRRSLGIVLQDTNLFSGTVMDNIRYGNLDATDEECIAAAKLAGADDFITRLPNGYETELSNNGANLSQGQRQLIAIARAAVADPPVMILDEATSSIDTRTEAIVQRGMDKLMEGRTVFVIAHRLSTVMNSDVIMVLDHGRIIERGNHEQLIAQKGTYYQLYTGAFELE